MVWSGGVATAAKGRGCLAWDKWLLFNGLLIFVDFMSCCIQVISLDLKPQQQELQQRASIYKLWRGTEGWWGWSQNTECP